MIKLQAYGSTSHARTLNIGCFSVHCCSSYYRCILQVRFLSFATRIVSNRTRTANNTLWTLNAPRTSSELTRSNSEQQCRDVQIVHQMNFSTYDFMTWKRWRDSTRLNDLCIENYCARLYAIGYLAIGYSLKISKQRTDSANVLTPDSNKLLFSSFHNSILIISRITFSYIQYLLYHVIISSQLRGRLVS